MGSHLMVVKTPNEHIDFHCCNFHYKGDDRCIYPLFYGFNELLNIQFSIFPFAVHI